MSCNNHSVRVPDKSIHQRIANITQKEMFISIPDAGISQSIREVWNKPCVRYSGADILKCLDTGDEFPYQPEASSTQVAVAFAGTLLAMLLSLPESIVPAHVQSRCLGMTNRDEAFEVGSHSNFTTSLSA